MLDTLRTTLHRAITSTALDGFAPVRVPRDLARRLNMTLGQPLCSADALAERRAARARLVELRRGGTSKPLAREPMPVTIYFEKGRNERELARMCETLEARAIAFKKLDVSGDEATLDFVCRTAKAKSDELPIVFVGATPIGGFRDLVSFDASGELLKTVRGE